MTTFLDELEDGEAYIAKSHKSQWFSSDGSLRAEGRDREMPGRAIQAGTRAQHYTWSVGRPDGQRHRVKDPSIWE